MTPTLGDKIVAEMDRRGMLGSIFAYRQYQSLHRVNSIHELDLFLRANGFPKIAPVDDPNRLVGETQNAERRKNEGWLMLLDAVNYLFMAI
jgi:hypothetical protein